MTSLDCVVGRRLDLLGLRSSSIDGLSSRGLSAVLTHLSSEMNAQKEHKLHFNKGVCILSSIAENSHAMNKDKYYLRSLSPSAEPIDIFLCFSSDSG